MAWSRVRSQSRINELLTSVPSGEVRVSNFDEGYFEPRRRFLAEARLQGRSSGSPIVDIPANSAVLVDGVHVYVQLIGFGDALRENGHETQRSHERTLRFLDLHYRGCDQVIDEFEVQRVDYHGSRLHSVVVTPLGVGANELARLVQALAFATSLKATIEQAGGRVGDGTYSTAVRIGIETGRAVAVDSGRTNEPEPLFLGSPANYAAKLAEGTTQGIFLGARARAILGLGSLQSINEERAQALDPAQIRSLIQSRGGITAAELFRPLSEDAVFRAVGRLQTELASSKVMSAAAFTFHHHEPPLSTINFTDLMPSNTIRMPLVSMFADLSGFTKFVDACIATGRIPDMVTTLHVIRGESAACLRDDFDGRKVRFIGDCLHGLIAEGDRLKTDLTQSVESAVLCAGGLRSSFELARETLVRDRNIVAAASLGIAIGVELGQTPISRVGIRGERSVRCAASGAVSTSEEIQSGLDGTQTALGPEALRNASDRVRRLFPAGQPAPNLDYQAVAQFAVSAPTVSTRSREVEFRPHFKR